jgi:chromosome segregation ATPase
MSDQAAILGTVAELERVLEAQHRGHEQLLDQVRRNREAVRRADMEAIQEICAQQNAVGQDLAELEKERLALVGSLTRELAPEATRPLTVAEVAASLEPGAAERLQARAEALRPLVARVRDESSVVRQAAEALARHMTGIVQVVHSVLSRAPVYGRKGEITGGTPQRMCVDVRS